jgi:hypothetical protein
MNWHSPIESLLAQAPYTSGRRGSQVDGLDPGTWALLLIALLAGLLVTLLVARRITARHSPGYHSPKALFRELCRVHRLDGKSRRALMRLAQQQGVDPPTLVFLEPDRFPSRATTAPDPLSSVKQVLFAEAVGSGQSKR